MTLARILTSCLAVAWLAATACGCGMELVRPSVEPPALEGSQLEARLDGQVVCHAGGDTAYKGAAYDFSVERWWLAKALRDSGAFRDVLTEAPPETSSTFPCDARLKVELVSTPVVFTGGREAIFFLTVFPGLQPIGVPLCFVWTDREPELVSRYVLEVCVRGEEERGARYEATARGTIEAQTPNGQQTIEGLHEARAELLRLGLRSMLTRFAADREAQARLRAQLSDGPALELEPLLVAKETHAPRARWRTRRVIGWKNESMAAIVAEAKASDLRAQISRLETNLVDLSHEAEVEKDAAQGHTAKGAEAEARDARELSLAYRERVEVLRAILAAYKDELEGRGR